MKETLLPEKTPRAPLLRERYASFCHACRGLKTLVVREPNARIYLAATIAVAFAGWGFHLRAAEWAWLVVATTLVWGAEALNSALENLADEVSLERRDRIGRAKDLGAASVLVASIGAAALGILVFTHRL